MLRLILPVLLAVVGTGGGIAAAMMLAPGEASESDHGEAAATEDHAALEGIPPCGPAETATAHAEPASAAGEAGPAAGHEYFKMNNQFVVPLVASGKVHALVVASLSLEILAGTQPTVFEVEPRLRDALLQVLFDHANLGGFDGVFTSASNMRALRTALRSESQRIVGPSVYDVLITDLVRQEADS